jgi:hydroxyacylglutathione hydrolase
MALEIHQFLIGSDNFGVLLHDPATGKTASIDAGEEAPIMAALTEKGWRLTDILVTHHHGDHIAALSQLKARFDAHVVGALADQHRIAGIDLAVSEGDQFSFGSFQFDVIETPGHTVGHIAFYCAAEAVLFAGDTLFSMGCGRLFEGTPQQMWSSLSKLATLPDATKLYCGHEYTLPNAKFALRFDADNPALQTRATEVEALRARGAFTIPSTIGLEKATNPFLRAGDPALARAVGLVGHPAVDVFAALREAKNKG